ncbi:hypothetical protein [Kitasatospora sp. NBC_01266]|uniref:hypothetical protein n=1 Tax=Kitasatospora sp. NBC_01266 TaxID=2903572 RepID=UPI002E3428B5|nr:hypothetical protein [Kitasatospora sp. NBC_01266]
MGTGDTGRAGSGGGLPGCVLIVVALGVLLGLLYLEHDPHGGGRGTGHDPVNINLPKTVEGKRRLDSSTDLTSDPDVTTTGLSSGLSTVSQGVYGDAPGTATLWALTTTRNHGQVGGWLAAHAPSPQGATLTHPRLRIAGTTTCYQDQHADRTLCTWYDENYLLQVSGPADPDTVQQVLLRIYDGTEH